MFVFVCVCVLQYARDTQHEKIQRGLALGISMVSPQFMHMHTLSLSLSLSLSSPPSSGTVKWMKQMFSSRNYVETKSAVITYQIIHIMILHMCTVVCVYFTVHKLYHTFYHCFLHWLIDAWLYHVKHNVYPTAPVLKAGHPGSYLSYFILYWQA